MGSALATQWDLKGLIHTTSKTRKVTLLRVCVWSEAVLCSIWIAAECLMLKISLIRGVSTCYHSNTLERVGQEYFYDSKIMLIKSYKDWKRVCVCSGAYCGCIWEISENLITGSQRPGALFAVRQPTHHINITEHWVTCRSLLRVNILLFHLARFKLNTPSNWFKKTIRGQVDI